LDKKPLYKTRKAQMRYRTLYECLPSIHFILNTVGLIFSISSFGATYLGYTVEELIGQSIFSLVHPEDREKLKGIFASSIQSATFTDCKHRIRCRNGKTLWVKAIAKSVPNPDDDLSILLVWEDSTESYQIEQALQQQEAQCDALLKAQREIYLEQLVAERTAELTRVNQQLQQEIRERIQVEAALRESEYRYYTLAQMSPVGIFRTDPDGGYLYVNQRWCEIAGISLQDTLGDSWTRAVHPGDRDRILTKWYRSVHTKQPFQADYRFQRPDGVTSWVIGQAIAEKGDNGEVRGYLGTITDITDRIQAEEAMRQSEAENRALIAAIPDALFRLHTNGTFLDFIPAENFELLLSPSEFIGKKATDVLPRQMAKQLMNALEQVQQTSNPQIFEYQIVIRGTLFDYEARIALSGNDNEEVLAIVRDISARKQAERALTESREKYRVLFQSVPIGISITDEAGKIIEANPASERILGVSTQEHTSEAFDRKNWQIIQPDGTPMANEEFASVIALTENRAIENVEMGIVKPDGATSWISVTASPIPLEGYGVAIAYTDITRRKQAEAALRQQFLRERLIGAIEARIRKSLNLVEVLNTTVIEVRQFLATDRVIIYRFEPNASGVVVVESVDQQWTSLLGRRILDTCLTKEICMESYRQGHIQAVEDIYTAGLQECYINLLTRFQVRANLVVPILQGEQLWGLLVAQHCTAPRQWLSWEIELLQQLASQVGIAIQQAELYQQLEAANQQLQRLAALDGLTQVANRRRFDEYLEQEWRRLTRERQPLSLILCDVDFFKLYNDTYGHQAGDECLKQIAATLQRAAKRPADLVARYGGEEFAIILPNTSQTGALFVAESIRKAVKNLRLAHANSTVSPYVTLSLGVAGMVPSLEVTFAALVATADAALYEAKETGRDRTIIHRV
jgi:diguanylate cyclase (GGDEF)-like protein/PAS domain S-box-containing protein